MMKGIIDYLLGPSENAKTLRDTFYFKIIPMLNVDGVVNGSSRCNLAGVDLNRTWDKPSKKLNPSAYHMKEMVIEL
jgi:murein tripeptide amidase MpaA